MKTPSRARLPASVVLLSCIAMGAYAAPAPDWTSLVEGPYRTLLLRGLAAESRRGG
jgi:hypothetical protein